MYIPDDRDRCRLPLCRVGCTVYAHDSTYNDPCARHAAETPVPSNTNIGRVVFAVETRLRFEITLLTIQIQVCFKMNFRLKYEDVHDPMCKNRSHFYLLVHLLHVQNRLSSIIAHVILSRMTR
jgi:hypothetical protein